MRMSQVRSSFRALVLFFFFIHAPLERLISESELPAEKGRFFFYFCSQTTGQRSGKLARSAISVTSNAWHANLVKKK